MNLGQLVAQLDPDYQRKMSMINAQIQSKYEIEGAKMQVQREIAAQQIQAQQRMEYERKQGMIETERLRGANERELLERKHQLDKEMVEYSAMVQVMAKGYSDVLDDYTKRRNAIYDSISKGREFRQDLMKQTFASILGNLSAEAQHKRDLEKLHLQQQNNVSNIDFEQRFKMALFESEQLAKKLDREYQQRGEEGVKRQIDEAMARWGME
jgi:hypothetical protein